MESYITLNGKRVILTDDITTAAQARSRLGIATDDVLMRQEGSSFRPVGSNEPIRDKDRLTAVPTVTKGAGAIEDSPWVQQDVHILRQALGSRSPVAMKPVERGGQRYLAVQIDNIRLNAQKFDRTSGKVLFLLPRTYPAMPPIGVYVNYPYKMQPGMDDHHFLRATAYGAPDLQQAGWFWYCLQPVKAATWRPQASPADGHNLLSLFGAASHALNS